MALHAATGPGALDLIGAAFSTPLTPVVLAAVIATGMLVLLPRRAGVEPDDVHRRGLGERRALRGGAAFVIIAVLVDVVVRSYVLDLSAAIAWWRCATALLAATVPLAVVLLAGRGGRPEPGAAPVVTGVRRTWTSFAPRAGILAVVAAAIVLVATTIAAGAVVWTSPDGRSAWLEIPIANEQDVDPIRLPFYGYSFGAPVLIAMIAMLALAWAVLHLDAASPYLRAQSITAERTARRRVAVDVLRIAGAALLLALAAAWRLIASAGSVSQLIIDGQNDGRAYEVAWRYAEFAVAGGVLAPVLEIAGFVLLLLVVARRDRRGAASAPSNEGDLAEIVR